MAKRKTGNIVLFKVSEVRPVDSQLGRQLTIFLNTLATCGQIARSCKAAGVTSGRINKLKKESTLFLSMFQEAQEHYRDRLRQAIDQRAVVGVEEPVYYQGVMVGTTRKYSDKLLELAARAHCPEFKEKTVDVNVNSGVLVIAAPRQSHEEWLKQQLQEEQDVVTISSGQDKLPPVDAESVKVLEEGE